MSANYSEWIKQADYDFDTAQYMYQGKRYFYAVFMCHLSIEKALKGLFYQKKKSIPPKSHNLIYFLKEIDVKPTDDIGIFIVKLNEASVATRYPEDLARISKNYTEPVVKKILENTKDVLEWIKQQF